MLRAFSLTFAIFFALPAYAGGMAIVDFEQAVNETNEGKAAQGKLDTMYSSRKAEIESFKVTFEKEAKDYQSRAMILSPEARAEAEGQLMRKQQEFEAKYMGYQQEMQQAYMGMLQDLDKKMRAMTITIAREKGYDVVLDRAAVVYAGASTVDMTGLLIKRYNEAGQ